jgi:hypothetical protein
MEDLVKRECIEFLVEQGIGQSESLFRKMGIEITPIDSIDKKLIIDKMMKVCDSTGTEIKLCEEFLASEVFTRYSESISKMTEVIFNECTNIAELATKH